MSGGVEIRAPPRHAESTRLLSERGLEPSAIRGTGPADRITVEDVLRAAPGGAADRRRDAGAARAAATLATESEAGASAAGIGTSHRVPHTAIRKRIADHMVQSLLHTAPHVTTVFEADLSAVLADRALRREEFARRGAPQRDRKSTRLNSSHSQISYAVFCLKKKKTNGRSSVQENKENVIHSSQSASCR